MRKSEVLCFAFIFLICVFLFAGVVRFLSPRPSDLFQAQHITSNSLRTLGFALKNAFQASSGIEKCNSLKEIIEHLENGEFIEKGEASFLTTDHWGRPFQLVRMAQGKRIKLLIYSFGDNGVDEGGKGDDLFVELVVVGKNVKMKLTKVVQNGGLEIQEY